MFISLFVPLTQNSVFSFVMSRSFGGSPWGVGADGRFVRGFPMGNCTRHEDFVQQKIPTSNISWCGRNSPRPADLLCDPFVCLGLSLSTYKKKFLFPDSLFASSFPGFCSDDRWGHVGVPYDQLVLCQSSEPTHPCPCNSHWTHVWVVNC